MRKIVILLLLSCVCIMTIAQPSVNDDNLKKIEEICSELHKQQIQTDKVIFKLSEKQKKDDLQIRVLSDENAKQSAIIDSLQKVCRQLENVQAIDRKEINGKIDITDSNIRASQDLLNNRTLWGGIIIFVIAILLIAIAYIFYKRIKKGTSTIDDVRKAHEALQAAQSKMQEDSVKLDNQLLELIQQQIANTKPLTDIANVDHTLVLQIVKHITRIELNLSRMDESTRGYKQLSKAVENIKINLQSYGYEIVNMLGKPYNEGMKVVANFVPDETLKEGEQIITGITKPQINFNGRMIQAAQITVSQNI